MPEPPTPDSQRTAPRIVTHARTTVGGGSALPRPLTRLIGREQEVADVVSLAGDPAVRLLTLTGPGGVGKTRLAVAAAAGVTDAFSGGVVFVDLAPVSNASLVPNAIANCLGIRDIGAESMSNRVMLAIGERCLLLVLDNFEQVIVAAPWLRDLLDACPEVTLLITSRIRLRIYGEREYPVGPLPLEAAARMDEETPGAVRLFFERAQAVQPDFIPSATTTPVVAEIVRRVDGLPLAIELAAARIRALQPEALLQRMDQRLPMLSGGARDLPLRQQTMRDAIGWSYDLLDDAEQELFRRLGVFAGGFTLEAAGAIGTAPLDGPVDHAPDASFDALDGITVLIEHSLVRQSPENGNEPHYMMLETVREFALDRLLEMGEEDTVRRRQAAFYVALAKSASPEFAGPSQAEWSNRLVRERANLRAVLDWALDHGEVETALALGSMLWKFWARKGFLSEGRSDLARVLAVARGSASLHELSGALTCAGVLAAQQGDYDEAIRLSEDALAGWRELDNTEGIGLTLLCLAGVARFRDDYAGAVALGRESLAAFRDLNHAWGIGHVLAHLGMVAWVQGDHLDGRALYEEALTQLRAAEDESGIFEVLLELGKGASDEGDLSRAMSLFEECLALCLKAEDSPGRGEVLTEIGVVALLQGDFGRARDLLTEATAVARENGDRRQLAYLAAHLGDVDVATGEIGAAAARYATALELFLPMGNRTGIAQSLEAIAGCAALRGQPATAIRLFGSCAALFASVGATPPPNHDPVADAERLRSMLTPADFKRVWNEGWALTVEEVAAGAMAVAAGLAAEEDSEQSPATLAASSQPASSQRVVAGDGSPSVAATLGLTPREAEVLRLLAEGKSDRDIAEALSISERTAGNHVQHAMQKIGVESRTAAAVFAVRHRLD